MTKATSRTVVPVRSSLGTSAPLPNTISRRPRDDYVWTPGYWGYQSDGYYWVPGAWVLAPYVGALWTPSYWAYDDGHYGWHRGYWSTHIGYYGGIDYGYGYTGAATTVLTGITDI